jgi:hypothetical protein
MPVGGISSAGAGHDPVPSEVFGEIKTTEGSDASVIPGGMKVPGGDFPPATTMTVALPWGLAAFVNDKISQGLYLDGGAVVRDALRRMRCDPCVGANKSSGLMLSGQALSAASSTVDGRTDTAYPAVQDTTDDWTLLGRIQQLKQELDSLSEMGEMESLRLQMAMDRMSKLMSTLSNLLKKISDTAQSITQNLK